MSIVELQLTLTKLYKQIDDAHMCVGYSKMAMGLQNAKTDFRKLLEKVDEWKREQAASIERH